MSRPREPGAHEPGDLPAAECPAESVPAPSEPVPDAFSPETPRDPHWFKTAVFYEVSVRGFADSNNDGY
ncbi:hypothetical protein, partial [Actinomadura sp. CNU-125]|uniref:hypothetical protein n=1 Tax=Actinomadura sp. CNU-125 TaxID=1904961 RepID=UPI001177F297